MGYEEICIINEEKQVEQVDYVRILPLKEQSIRVKVKSVEKAKPNIVVELEETVMEMRDKYECLRNLNL